MKTLEDIKKEGIQKNTIYNGDCFDIMHYIKDKSIDLVLTDPPYGITECSWDNVPNLKRMWQELKRIGKDNCAYLFTASQPFATDLINSNRKWFKYEWIWIKERGTGFAFSKKQPMRKTEYVVVFYKKQPKYDYIGKKLNKPYRHVLPIVKSPSSSINSNNLTNTGDRIYSEYTHTVKDNLIYINRDNNRKNVHPTQKPVALGQYLIRTYTNEGDLVFDGFAGSGSFLVAAMLEKRNFIGCEIDNKYYEIAKKRLEDTQKEINSRLFF